MGELVRMIDDEARTTSLMVAETFGKQHQHVMRSIDALLKERPALAPNFGRKFADVATGKGGKRQMRYYTMNRDGFMLLVMGFTGAKALDLKIAYIGEFNRMEAVLASQPAADMVPVARSVLLNHPLFATPEARDALQNSMTAMRRIERAKGKDAAYAFWLESGLPDVDVLMAKHGIAKPKLEERPIASVLLWAEDAGVSRSATSVTTAGDLFEDYRMWATTRDYRFLEPGPFGRMVREHFQVEKKNAAYPLMIARASVFG